MILADMKVRVKNNPSMVGVATASVREQNGRVYRTVLLSDGKQKNLLESLLEPLVDVPDALVDLEAQKFSAASDLARLLTHIRLTGHLADLIYSMESTNTDFHAYQFKPVIKILNSASKGLLIADEVGLGKTIEAGLVWTELVARYDVHRLLVVCPKSLQEKWRVELRDKFGISAKAVEASELLTVLKEAETRGGDFAVVATLTGIRAPKGWDDEDQPTKGASADLNRFLFERAGSDPIFDMVVFDEAHHLRNPDTAQHKTARRIIELSDYKLMLSATPINLRSEDLRSILRLVEPDLFDREWIFGELQTENVPIVAAREQALSANSSLLEVAESIASIGAGRLLKTDRRLEILKQQLLADPTTDTPERRASIAARLEEMSMLGGIVNRTRRRDVTEIQVKRRANTRTWQMSPVENAFYERATDAICRYAADSDLNDRFLLSNSQRMLASCLPAAFRRWASALPDIGLEGDDDQRGNTPGPLVTTLANECRDPELFEELRASDNKFALLSKALADSWAAKPDEKIIVFSSYIGTIDYLEERLIALNTPCVKMHGSVKRDRDLLLQDFARTEGPCVLLTSEVGGEGLDLQFCSILVNYDLPWNPMKVEQRIGRIDRIGQRAPSIEIFSLICEGTIEARIFDRLYTRLELIERTLGGFEPILGALVKELEGRLLDPTLLPDEIDQELERAATAAEQRKLNEESLEKEASGLIAHGDMILHRIKRNHEQQRWVHGRELLDYVKSGLQSAFPGTVLDRAPIEDDAYDLRLCHAAHLAFCNFLEQRARRFNTRLRRTETVRIVFGKKPGGLRDQKIEIVTSTHPLVRFVAKLREDASGGLAARPALWGTLDADSLPTTVKAGDYGLVVQRWSIDGVTPQDKLVYSGVNLDTCEALSDDDAELIVGAALTSLKPVTPGLDRAQSAAQMIRTNLILGRMAQAQDAYIGFEEAIHDDKRATLLAVLRHQLNSYREKAETRIRDYLSSGGARARIAPMEQGKLKKYVARMELKIDAAMRESGFAFDEPTTYGVLVAEVR